ncbi:MAG TPA: hypothetical protein VK465_10110 [Fibrobacteria bacterium]|nr:hypothetical protein [Fibrobacteria bacterium]
MESLRTHAAFPADSGPRPARPASRAPTDFVPVRGDDFEVRLAGDLPDLESALALERRVYRAAAGGVDEPTAVPYCDFLLAADSSGTTAGVCRLLPHGPRALRHGLPGAARDAGMGLVFPGSAPLLTAIRYAGLGVLEAGAMTVDPGADGAAVCRTLWRGLARRLADLGYGFALGRERVVPVPGVDLEPALLALQESHGLHPDLEEERGLPLTQDRSRADELGNGERTLPSTPRGPLSGRGALDWLPMGLKEGLRQGCRLAGSPVFHAAQGCLEFVWVASLDMLEGEAAGR